jgi:integrase
VSVYQRKDGRWVATLEFGGQQRRRKSFYGTTQAEAVGRRDAAANGQPSAVPRYGRYAEQWLDTIRPTVKPTTWASYRWMLGRYVTPAIGHVRLDELTVEHVRGVLVAPVSPRTTAYALAILRRSLTHAERVGLLNRNVARLVDPPRQVRPLVKTLTVEEAKAMLEAAEGHPLQALWTLLLCMGLRRGEGLGLEWKNVDLERGMLTVAQSVVAVENRVEFSTPKSGRVRTLPMPTMCADALRGLGGGEGLVFPTRNGTPIAPRNLTRSFHALCEKAGLQRLNLHSLRHSCATFLLAEGVPPAVIKELLGHSSIQVTLDVYAHVLPPATRAAAMTMDSLLTAS